MAIYLHIGYWIFLNNESHIVENFISSSFFATSFSSTFAFNRSSCTVVVVIVVVVVVVVVDSRSQ